MHKMINKTNVHWCLLSASVEVGAGYMGGNEMDVDPRD